MLHQSPRWPHMPSIRGLPRGNVGTRTTPTSRGMILSLLLCFIVCPIAFVTGQSTLSLSEDGRRNSCNIFAFVPFTDNGTDARSISGRLEVIPGFVHMAAALMAMDHFNQRNTSVVPELEHYINCSVQLDVNASQFFDSGTVTHLAAQSLFQAGVAPCTIAGPYHDTPALELSALALAAQFPLVAHRSFTIRTVLDQINPYSNQVYPDNTVLVMRLVDFLFSKGRTNYISILYPLTDSGLQWKDILTFIFQAYGIDTFAHEIYNPHQEQFLQRPSASVNENMDVVKKRGFRTIVVPMENPLETLPLVANAAEECHLNNGDYFWVFLGDFSATHLYSNNSNITKLVYGSALMFGIESMYLKHKDDPFHAALTSQGPDFVERVNGMNPIAPDQLGYVFADPDFFTNLSDNVLEHGSGFMYDAVMSIGMGLCWQESQYNLRRSSSSNTTVDTGGTPTLLEGIRHSNFTGASGQVRFQKTGTMPGARDVTTAILGVFNLLPQSDTELELPHKLTDVFRPEMGHWESLTNFTYADGSHQPPALLRDPPPQNYLPEGYRILGFVLLGTVLASAVASCIWVYLYREHRVLRAAQPAFLYVLAFGSAVFSSAIIPLSFDESYGWNEAQMSAGCMSIPWLVGVGHIITYSALFAKLWRVNKVLQFTRRQIKIRQVVWPAAMIVVAALLDLSLWTALDPAQWTRVIIDPSTGESIGYCHSNNMWAFAAPLAVLMILPSVLTAVMAYKTKDVDEAYSESSWIFTLILLQVELVVIAAPVIAILRTLSTTGKYLGFVVVLWVLPMSTLTLILLPKVVAHRQALTGVGTGHKRGSRATGRVSGVPGASESNYNSTSRQVLESLHSEASTHPVRRRSQQQPPALSTSHDRNSAVESVYSETPPAEPPTAAAMPDDEDEEAKDEERVEDDKDDHVEESNGFAASYAVKDDHEEGEGRRD